MERTIDNSTSDFCRAAAWLVGGGIVVGLSLLPFAMARSGTGSPTGLLAAAVICVTAGAIVRMLCEEALLMHQYADYAAYAQRTKRMVPYLF